jgi:hypothetical protein
LATLLDTLGSYQTAAQRVLYGGCLTWEHGNAETHYCGGRGLSLETSARWRDKAPLVLSRVKVVARRMFLFFSNRIGCLASIAISIVLTALLLLFLGIL